jgi:glycyl-tRNA synthetase beta subunit
MPGGVDGLSAELDRIVFIEGMGTIGQKWRRVLCPQCVNARAARGRADDACWRAPRAAKADLASTMIRDSEFTRRRHHRVSYAWRARA